MAPSLDSGSLKLPHLGDCTQDGHPEEHGHVRKVSRVAGTKSSPAS